MVVKGRRSRARRRAQYMWLEGYVTPFWQNNLAAPIVYNREDLKAMGDTLEAIGKFIRQGKATIVWGHRLPQGWRYAEPKALVLFSLVPANLEAELEDGL